MTKRTRAAAAAAAKKDDEAEKSEQEVEDVRDGKTEKKMKKQKPASKPSKSQKENDENPEVKKEQKPASKEVKSQEDHDGDRDDDENLTTFQLDFKKDKHIYCETRQCFSTKSSPSLIFTHGAGGGLESSAMRTFATGFSRCGRITSFRGNMNLTSRVGMFRTVISHHQEEHKESALVLGGRSMGARAAVLTALELISEGIEVQALVLVSYPLTATKNGKQEREFERREKILLDLPDSVDVLFVSGTRDVMCELEALAELRQEMKAESWMVEAKDADHGMTLVPKAGTQEFGELMGEVAARWLEERDKEKRFCEVYWNVEEETACQGSWCESRAAVGEASQPAEKKRKKD